ncbi:MAG: hypothetical protein H8F28_19835 [Fibrella sp.]|nr:hypothetical protein [Armatimonadota bacterium]
MPAQGDIHIDRALTNVSIAYQNEEFVGEQIAPPLKVDKRSDKYFVYNKNAFLRGSGKDANGRPKSLRRPGAEADEVDYDVSSTPFYCEEYAKKTLVTDAVVRIADMPLQPYIDATQVITERLKIDNEIATASLTCTSTNYPAANKVLLTTGGAGTSWASYGSANSKPLSNIRDGKISVRKGIMRQPNSALFSVDAAQVLADHPDVKDLTKYTHSDGLSSSGLPKVLRGLNTIEGATQAASSAEGAAFSSGNIWQDENGTNVSLIFYRSADAGPRSMHFARSFDAPDDTTGAQGINVRKYRWDIKKGTYVEAAFTRDWRFIAIDDNAKAIGGYLISGTTV